MAGYLGLSFVTSSEASSAQAVNPEIEILGGGRFLTASNAGHGRVVTVQLTKADGSHINQFNFNPTLLYGSNRSSEEPGLTALPGGGFVAAVNINESFSDTDLWVQKFNASGGPVGQTVTVDRNDERMSGDIGLETTSLGYVCQRAASRPVQSRGFTMATTSCSTKCGWATSLPICPRRPL